MLRIKVTITGFLDVEPEDYADEPEDDEDVDLPDDSDIFAALEEEFEDEAKGLSDLEDQSISFERVGT